LGYKILFDLKEFVLSSNGEISYYGSTRFEELIPESESQKSDWKESRENAYNGSLRHFLVSLSDDRLEENGFYTYIINSPNWDNLRRRDFLVPNFSVALRRVSEIERGLQFNNYIMITYMEEWEESGFLAYRNYLGSKIFRELDHQTSWITLPYGYATFDINGNIVDDYKSIKVYGYWGWQKVANLLPTNYVPTK